MPRLRCIGTTARSALRIQQRVFAHRIPTHRGRQLIVKIRLLTALALISWSGASSLSSAGPAHLDRLSAEADWTRDRARPAHDLPIGSSTDGVAPTVPVSRQLREVTRMGALGQLSLVSSLSAGEVEIAQFGEPEDRPAFIDRGFLAIRFDPPFLPPYSISGIAFPSFTLNRVPATFQSIRLCSFSTITGQVDLANPLFMAAPYVGNSDGLNEISLEIPVSEFGQTFFLCFEFPTTQTSEFPNDFPYLRTDILDLDRGSFGNSHTLLSSGFPIGKGEENLIGSLTCRLQSQDLVPIAPARNLGVNLRDTKMEFRYLPPDDVRADGSAMPPNSLERVDLLCRSTIGPWIVCGSGGAGSRGIVVDGSPPGNGTIWAAQAVDKSGRRAILSSITATTAIFSSGHDADEPNGRINEGTALSLPQDFRDETCYPSGDQDFYTFDATPGDTIVAYAASIGADGRNDLDLAMILFDQSGRMVASDDNSRGELDPQITYPVPDRLPVNSGKRPSRRYSLQVMDKRGSALSPTTAPRLIIPAHYGLFVRLAPAGPLAPPQAVERGWRLTARCERSRLVQLTYSAPPGPVGAGLTLLIFDARGRLVRTLLKNVRGEASASIMWDGRDDQGLGVASGIYYVRLTGGGVRKSTKVAIIR